LSWYQEKLNKLSMENAYQFQESLIPDKKLFNTYSRNITITLIITNMYTETDSQKLSSKLLTLEGVNKVQTILNNKRLIISYDIRKTKLETVTYTIAKLGYHYLQRG